MTPSGTHRHPAQSFGPANKARRALWGTVWLLLAAWTPNFMHGWRRALLRLFGAQLSNTCAIYSTAVIWDPQNLEMGEYACLGPRVNCYSMARISLRDYAIASQGAHLCAGTHDIDDPCFPIKAAPIVLGENAWVAAEAFVGPGVTVGEGAVLGARAVTFSDLAPWTVYAGNPARELRRRLHPGSDAIEPTGFRRG